MAYFFKYYKNRPVLLGASPPDPLASGLGALPQTPSFRRLHAPPSDPLQNHPMRILATPLPPPTKTAEFELKK